MDHWLFFCKLSAHILWFCAVSFFFLIYMSSVFIQGINHLSFIHVADIFLQTKCLSFDLCFWYLSPIFQFVYNFLFSNYVQLNHNYYFNILKAKFYIHICFNSSPRNTLKKKILKLCLALYR